MKYFLALALYSISGLAAAQHGHFVGDLVVKMLSEDGRKVELLQDFSFVDPAGKIWTAKKGAVVDGASIPQAAWSLIGGPFEGKYRDASVIHDVACVEQTATWKDAHRAFYNGMRARGVGSKKAKMMYAAVYWFGPRWQVQLQVAFRNVAELRRYANKIVGEPGFKQVHLVAFEKSNGGHLTERTLAMRVEPHGAGTEIVNPNDDFLSKESQAALNAAEIVYFNVDPVVQRMTQPDFDRLKAEIESNDIDLDAIEAYRP